MIHLLSIAGALTLLSIISTPAPVHPPASRPAQIILIRHAEKPDDPANPHLSPAGVKRAQSLVSFIATDPAMRAFGAPAGVFATHETKNDDGQRTQETVTPLAKSLSLPVQAPYLGKDFAMLAKHILANPAYAGKTVIICWNHEEIPQLAAALGVTPEPPKWKGSVFDQVYIIKYHGDKATLTTSRY
jgi:hypothetical protein